MIAKPKRPWKWHNYVENFKLCKGVGKRGEPLDSFLHHFLYFSQMRK